MLGGHSAPKPADEDAQAIADSVKASIEQELGKSFNTFRVNQYTTQVVAGTNYKLKIEADGDFLHAVVFKPLPHTGEAPSLSKVESGKTLNDPL